nr:hypothetical protein CFP56_58382 [Quercus suber]
MALISQSARRRRRNVPYHQWLTWISLQQGKGRALEQMLFRPGVEHKQAMLRTRNQTSKSPAQEGYENNHLD